MASALQMVHDADPRIEIMDALGQVVKKFSLPAARILVAVYRRPEKIKFKSGSELYLPDNKGPRVEDEFQGKAGLILAMGPLAFTEDETHKFGVTPKVGDWILSRPGDSFPFKILDRSCRIIEDADVHAIVEEPDLVW